MDITAEIYNAQFSGSPERLRELRLCRNTIDLKGDERIYRVLDLAHFMRDLAEGVLTMAKVAGFCLNENPIMDKKIVMEGEIIGIRPLLEPFYASCWSLKRLKNVSQFITPSEAGVRIESTPDSLQQALCRQEDTHYWLHNFIGRMKYRPTHELDKWIRGFDSMTLADTLRLKCVQTLLLLDREHRPRRARGEDVAP